MVDQQQKPDMVLSKEEPRGTVNSVQGKFVPNALAKRVAQPKPTGCDVTDTDNRAQHRAFQHLITYLQAGNMHKCMSVLSHAVQEKKGDQAESLYWDPSYYKFGKLPLCWKSRVQHRDRQKPCLREGPLEHCNGIALQHCLVDADTGFQIYLPLTDMFFLNTCVISSDFV